MDKEIADEIKTPASSGKSQRLEEANLWALQQETRTLAAEIDMLNQELLSQPMRAELYGAQRQLASLEWERGRWWRNAVLLTPRPRDRMRKR